MKSRLQPSKAPSRRSAPPPARALLLAALGKAVQASAAENIGFARIDHAREARKGFPEVVFGPGKTTAQLLAIARRILKRSGRLLITRVDAPVAARLLREFPTLEYHAVARAVYQAASGPKPSRASAARPPAAGSRRRGHVLVVTAGTGDIPVAEEAALTARLLGCRVETLYDVGVAGLHRLLAQLPRLKKASVIVTVAGMEGALPSVLAGLVDVPVIGVPTSIGYGASLGGLSALLGMLNSCASGLTVVNIDNGFGAGFAAAQMLRSRAI